MDMTFEAAPMTAVAQMNTACVTAQKVITHKVISLIERVASMSCPSIAGHSLSAVAPDHIFEGGTALAAA